MFNLDRHDRRHPHFVQMVRGVVLDHRGRPVCSETWPGKTFDAKAMMPIIDRRVFKSV